MKKKPQVSSPSGDIPQSVFDALNQHTGLVMLPCHSKAKEFAACSLSFVRGAIWITTPDGSRDSYYTLPQLTSGYYGQVIGSILE